MENFRFFRVIRSLKNKKEFMEKQEVRLPIVGVIKEEENGYCDSMCNIEHYPQGEGLYLVKVGKCYKELRRVSGSYENKDGRVLCRIERIAVPSEVIVEEIKKEHEATIKEYIAATCEKLYWASRTDVSVDHLPRLPLPTDEDTPKSTVAGNGVSEATLLKALEIVSGVKAREVEP